MIYPSDFNYVKPKPLAAAVAAGNRKNQHQRRWLRLRSSFVEIPSVAIAAWTTTTTATSNQSNDGKGGGGAAEATYPIVRFSDIDGSGVKGVGLGGDGGGGWAAAGRKRLHQRDRNGQRPPQELQKPPISITSGADNAVVPMSLWHHYCLHSTVHGFKYLAKSTALQWWQRLIWMVLILLAGLGILYLSFLLQLRFASKRLATTVESTVFPIAEIPYPAVTICNYNRINWHRVPAAIDFYLPNGTESQRSKLVQVLNGLNTFEFGSFDAFNAVKEMSLRELEHINITELYRMVNHRCEELFVAPCWWRNKYLNCCSLFAEQKSEYGICYAFNSATSPVGKQRMANESNYPWRTSNYGDWSGLRANVRVSDGTRMPGLQTPSGILVSVHHPSQWPNSAHFVPAASQTSVIVKPTYSYVMSDLYYLPVADRECLFPDDIARLNLCTLPDQRYLRPNCISACRQSHMLSTCNCTLDFIFPVGDLQQCNISDLQCLFHYDDVFNYEKPPAGNPYFGDDEVGMVCNCLPECEKIDYDIEINTISNDVGYRGATQNTSDVIQLDVHFQQASMVKYCTARVFDWVDLLVAFGGIAGLFMGCSLLSIVEGILYVTLGLMRRVHQKLGGVDQM